MTDKSKTPGQLLFEELNINWDEVPFEQLSHYTAVEYFLTVEDEPPSNTTNLEKVNRYLESFHHLCEVEDWNRANQIINYRLDTFNQKQLHDQLGIWSYYQKQIDLYRQLLGKLNSFTDGSCLNNLGSAYYFMGDYFKAINYYQQSLEIAIKTGERNNLSNSLMGLGSAYNFLGEYQTAIDYYQQSLKIAQEIGDHNGISNSLIGLGIAYNYLEEYQKAIDYYQQSLKIAQEIGNRNSEASAIENLGKSLFKLENYSKSMKNLQASLEIFRQIGNSANEAENLKLLGEVYQKLGNSNLAFDYCEQALELATKLSIPLAKECQDFKENYSNIMNNNFQKTLSKLLFEELAINFEEISIVHLSNYIAVEYFLTIEDESPSDTTNLAKINRYLESFHKSLEIAKQIGDRQRQTIALGNLGAVSGNLKNYEKAIDYFKPTNINSRCDRPTPYSNST